jgi:uroporphyrinogen-III synthase
MGHHPVRMPLFETIVTANVEDLPPSGEIGGLIATSARAFALFDSRDLSATGLHDVTIYAVGPATALAARGVGFTRVREGGGTAQALASALIEARMTARAEGEAGKAQPGPGKLVYLAGAPRTPVMETVLNTAGLGHTVLECYRMNEISYSTDILKSDILSPAPDAVLLYSANAARRLSALAEAKVLGKALDSARFFCFSPAIAAELNKSWQGRVTVARQPNEDSLLASLSALG